jgi:DNA (cytosine-5)-methyltransferase 1
MKTIKIGSDFSGVGAFNQALRRIDDYNFQHVFACDMDKFARQSYLANYEEPGDYPLNVYDREIPKYSLDIYMTSPPCQSFSLAGKRKGKDSENGVLFFNSHEFIKKNNPRHFIFENVKGLLSDDNGNTFKEWLNMLGGKSINGLPVMFPYEDSVPYHIYWKVLNSKKHGVPQNRERVFIVGIRDNQDNQFTWPKEEHLTTKLKDVLENDVPEKYFLSDKMVESFTAHKKKHNEKGTGFGFKPKSEEDIANCLRANGALCPTDNTLIVGDLNKGGERGAVYSESSPIMSCLSATDYKQPKQIEIKVNSATSKGYETATENDSINFTHPDSKTRRGRVGKEVAQTLDTSCNQGICVPVLTPDRVKKRQNGRRFKDDGEEMFTITTQDRHGVFDGFKIRKLTPRECFRLQDFPEDFKFVCSDSQLYKQAGNSITVRVLELIIRKLKL